MTTKVRPMASTEVFAGMTILVVLAAAAVGLFVARTWFSSKPASAAAATKTQDLTISPVGAFKIEGCEYLVMSNGEVVHKGNCPACRDWMLRALAAQSALGAKIGPNRNPDGVDPGPGGQGSQ